MQFAQADIDDDQSSTGGSTATIGAGRNQSSGDTSVSSDRTSTQSWPASHCSARPLRAPRPPGLTGDEGRGQPRTAARARGGRPRRPRRRSGSGAAPFADLTCFRLPFSDPASGNATRREDRHSNRARGSRTTAPNTGHCSPRRRARARVEEASFGAGAPRRADAGALAARAQVLRRAGGLPGFFVQPLPLLSPLFCTRWRGTPLRQDQSGLPGGLLNFGGEAAR